MAVCRCSRPVAACGAALLALLLSRPGGVSGQYGLQFNYHEDGEELTDIALDSARGCHLVGIHNVEYIGTEDTGAGDYPEDYAAVGEGGDGYRRTIDYTSGNDACNNGIRGLGGGPYDPISFDCPPCLIFQLHRALSLRIENCEKRVSGMTGMYVQGNTYTFQNFGSAAVAIMDYQSVHLLPPKGNPGSRMTCTCIEGLISDSIFAFGWGTDLPQDSAHGTMVCDSAPQPLAVHQDPSYPLFPTAHCYLIDDGDKTVTSTTSCQHKFCPQCYVFNHASTSLVTLTLSACSYYHGLYLNPQAVVTYTFSNHGAGPVAVADGTNTYTLGTRGTAYNMATCQCKNNLLSCDTPVVNNYVNMPASVRLNSLNLDFSGSSATYTTYDSSSPTTLKFYVSSTSSISMISTGGVLHGTWHADAVLQTSDSRLKRSIEPLGETLLRLQRQLAPAVPAEGEASLASVTTGNTANKAPVNWILSQLRPVSYVLERDSGGGRRFGFLAEELEAVFPDMVRMSEDANRTKLVHLNDLLAVLVAALQQQQREARSFEDRVSSRLSWLEAAVEEILSRLRR